MNMASSTLSIPDLQTGANYLAQLPLANPPLAEKKLLEFLDALLEAPPEAGTLLALLEQARVPLHFVEEELARRYHNKPLPLAEEEDEVFQQVLSAWKRMSRAYALCARLQEPMPDNP